MSQHDAQPLAAAETPWPLWPVEAAVEPVAGGIDARRRITPPPALAFEAMPEGGWIQAPASAPLAAVRLHFVPLNVLGEPVPDPAPTLVRVQKKGWSVREQSPGRRTRAGVDPVVVAVPEEAA